MTTATGVNKGKVKKADLIKVDLKGNRVQGKKKPSTELKLHMYIYEKRKDVKAIVHTHPRFATAFAAASGPGAVTIPGPTILEPHASFVKLIEESWLAKYGQG